MRAFGFALVIFTNSLYAAEANRDARIKELSKQLSSSETDNSSKDETISELINLNAKEAAPEILQFMVVEAEKGNLWMAEIAAVAIDTLDPRETVPRLSLLLQHRSAGVRLIASIALRHMKPEDSLAELRRLIKTKGNRGEDDIRISAMGEVKQRRALEAGPDLVAVIVHEAQQATLASAAADALRELDAKENVESLEKLAKHDKSPAVRYFAAEAIVVAKPELAYNTFKALLAMNLKGADAAIPEFAGRSLLQAQEPSFIPVYLKLLNGTQGDLQKFAVETLGEMKVKEAGPALIKLLSDRDSEMRATTIIALDSIGDSKLAQAAAEKMVKTKILAYTIPEIRNMNFSVTAGILCPPLQAAVTPLTGESKQWGQRWLDAARCSPDNEAEDPALAGLKPLLEAKDFCDRWGNDPEDRPSATKENATKDNGGCSALVDEAIKAYKKDAKNEEVVALIQEAYRMLPPKSVELARLKKETGLNQEK